MAQLKILSLNGADMIDLVHKDLSIPGQNTEYFWRAKLLAAIIKEVDSDIIGLVEAPPDPARTEKFIDQFVGQNSYKVYHGEKRGTLGLAILIRDSLDIDVTIRTKAESLKDFKLDKFDADGDGIKEHYSWWNRVPLEANLSGQDISALTTFVLIHAKSKGAFIPGDLFAYERLSKANRMKQRAQAKAIRKRLDQLVDEDGSGRVVVLGDMNDGPEFDIYSALLGGSFLEPLMGSIWDPSRVFHNTHTTFPNKDRWTIDFRDRVVNPLKSSRYGQPAELRSWIDHILVSPKLKDSVVQDSAGILHKKPRVPGLPSKHRRMRGTDHHPPYVTLDL